MKPLKLLVISILLTILTQANSELTVNTKLLQELTKGSKELKLLSKAVPGNVVVYEHTISNPTSTSASDLVFSDMIPKYTVYVPNSASCSGTCTIEYSVDGEVFEKPLELFVYNSSLELAKAKEYRYIRWTMSELKPNSTQVISFKTKIN